MSGFYKYRGQKDFDINSLKNKKDDDNAEIDGEWFGDGDWEFDDELVDIEEEDWEIWADWFDLPEM
jgi:hypothetical protein